MDLNVITKKDVAKQENVAAKPATADDASTKLLKYVPAVSAGTYLAVQNVIDNAVSGSGGKEVALWITFAVVLAGTYLFRRRRGVKRASQIAATLGALVVWVFALGGPFAASWSGYKPWFGSVALFLGAFLLVAWNPPPLPDDA